VTSKPEPAPTPVASTPSASSQWLKSNLVALGSAAVFTVYGAGFLRTRSAAQRFADEGSERRRPAPVAVAPNVTPAAAAPASITASLPSPLSTDSAPVLAPRARAARQTTVKTKTVQPVPAGSEKPAPTPAPSKAADSVVAPPPVAIAASVPTPTAPAPPAAAARTDSATQADKDHPHYHDGTFTGWGTSRHGDIQASVEIKGGRIVDAFVSICLTRYSCSIISTLPPQVVARQSADVDFVSGATQSTNAFYYAVVEALTKAK